MGKISKDKYNQVITLMLQDVPTDEIAKKTGYSIHTIRHVFAELREKYNVDTKAGIVTAVLIDKIKNIADNMNELISITEGAKISTYKKR